MKYLIIIIIILLTSCTSASNNQRTFDIGYNIFPISFSDSDGDGIGDINGITEKLDYLSDLGIDTIWINPIHESESYHKYDVLDYYSVDEDFGTIEDFENLIKEAHKRDINVIMDLVINHTSSKHKWFVEAKNDVNSEYRDYYRFYDFADGLNTFSTKDGWTKINDNTYYFASFWSEMPELNFENPKVTNEIYDIADFWLEKGVDGFRIDAVKHLFDPREYPKGTPTLKHNVEWFKGFKEHVQSKNPNVFVIGEVYDKYQSISPYYQGMDYLFNFSVAEKILNSVNSETNVEFNTVVEKSHKAMDKYSENSTGVQANFITNHDQNRSMSVFNGNLDKAKLASTIMFTLPGMPWIYYGEEIGMMGEGNDEYKREPINWGDDFTTSWETVKYNKNIVPVSEQVLDENSLYSTYKEMIEFRKKNVVLINGTFEGVESENDLLVYKVFDEEKTLLIVHNVTGEDVSISYEGEIIYTNQEDDKTNVIKPYKTIIYEVK